MDSSQKGELREINERNAQRVDARIDQRSAELRASMNQVDGKIDQRSAELHARISQGEARLDAKIDKMGAELREVLERRLGEQTRWLYLTWAVQSAMILGLYFK